MKKKVLIIIAVIALAAVMTAAFTSCTITRTMDDYVKQGYFTLGFDSSLPPMGFVEDGEYVGFDIDLAKEVAKKLGIEVKFQPIEWEQKEVEIKSGKIDVIWNGFTVTDKRKKQFIFSHNYMINKQTVVVKSDSAYTDLQSLLDNDKLKIAYQKGSTAETAITESELKNKTLTGVKDNDIAVTQELASGRVDCVVMDSVMANYKFGKQSAYRILNNIELASENYAIGFRKTESEFRDAVNKALVELYNDGTVKTIFEKYFSGDMDELINLPKE